MKKKKNLSNQKKLWLRVKNNRNFEFVVIIKLYLLKTYNKSYKNIL